MHRDAVAMLSNYSILRALVLLYNVRAEPKKGEHGLLAVTMLGTAYVACVADSKQDGGSSKETAWLLNHVLHGSWIHGVHDIQ